MPDQECLDRITKVEIKQEIHETDFAKHAKHEEEMQRAQAEKIDEYHEKQSAILLSIQKDLAKQKGFWSGVVFGVSTITTMIGLALSYLFNR